MDYYYLSRLVNEQIVDKWDHQYLNNILPFRTTAENMSHFIYGVLHEQLISNVSLKVTLKETAKSSAVVTPFDFDRKYFEALRNGDLKCQ
jgi:6-pyruvoyltetrahydropterin/6-carboxytetrahydropterin synthase